MGLPFVIIQLTIAWVLLQKFFPSQQKNMVLRLDGQFKKSWRAIVVYVTFAATILLWMTTKLHGMNTYVVSIIPLAGFYLNRHHGQRRAQTD